MTVAETLALDGALEGVELTDVDLANVDASRARMADVTIEGGRLTGLLWTEGVVRDCVLRRCRANLAGFAAARLSAVRFEACDLRESDFSDAALREVVFDGCDLTGADFLGARFAGCELRGCRLDGVRLGTELKGLGLSYGDLIEAAGTLAGALGIEVLET
jgi:uncharacterized protein YjbI with pentapeptide repeats